MGLRLREHVTIDDIRKYGFELGSLLLDNPSYARALEGCGYMLDWAHLMLTWDDNSQEVKYMDDSDVPVVHIMFRMGDYGRDLFVDAAPYCTYHIDSSDLDFVTDLIYRMTVDGLLELVEK